MMLIKRWFHNSIRDGLLHGLMPASSSSEVVWPHQVN